MKRIILTAFTVITFVGLGFGQEVNTTTKNISGFNRIITPVGGWMDIQLNGEGSSFKIRDNTNGANWVQWNAGKKYTEFLRDVVILGEESNMGIGTASPQFKLSIHQSGTITSSPTSRISITNTDTGINWSDGLQIIQNGNANNLKANFLLRENADMGFWTNSSERMTINNEGNIGIGTTNPRSILHVSSPSRSFNEGNQSVSANLLIEGTNTTRTTGAGAVLGFAIPANTDGSNLWQQGRIYVGADNANNGNAEGRMYLQTRYRNDGTWSWRNNLVLRPTGNVGIGTQSPDELLTVKGKIHAEEVRVDLSVPADYVFEKYYTGESQLKADYVMPTLEEVEAFTKVNNHLPSIPSAQEIQEEGLHLKEMTNLLLQKIEELTLYTIEQQKQLQAQQQEIQELKKKVK